MFSSNASALAPQYHQISGLGATTSEIESFVKQTARTYVSLVQQGAAGGKTPAQYWSLVSKKLPMSEYQRRRYGSRFVAEVKSLYLVRPGMFLKPILLSGLGALTDQEVVTWAQNEAQKYINLKDQGGVLPPPADYYQTQVRKLSEATAYQIRRGGSVFTAAVAKVLGTGAPTIDVAVPSPSPGAASAAQVQAAATGVQQMSSSYGDAMREAGALLQLAEMPTTALTQGADVLNAALVEARARLKAKLMSKCGDTAEQADARIAKGSSAVRSRLATCQSQQAAVTAAHQAAAAQAASQPITLPENQPPMTVAPPGFPWKLALGAAAGLGGFTLLLMLLLAGRKKQPQG